MPWRPGHKGKSCRICGRSVSEVGFISARGKCPECGVGRATDEIQQMVARSGPHFQHWRRRMAASVGGQLLDDAQDTG